MTALRCLICGRTFAHVDVYLHPAHSCCSRTRTAATAVEQHRTTAPASPKGAVVIPFPARRPQPRNLPA